MTDTSGFSNFVPGFEFLQGLAKNAGAAIPAVGQWVAPTLNPEELEKRIEELRTVQFWLEQNARMLAATIQALEVQRMTLSTLKTMNVQMSDLRDAMKIKVPTPADQAPEEVAKPAAAPPDEAAETGSAPPAVDPTQWWSALTKQFTELASNAIQEGAGKGLAAAMGRQTVDGVGDGAPVKKATPAPKKTSRSAAPRKRSHPAAKKAGSS